MTNGPKKGRLPNGSDAAERSCKGALTHNGSTLGDRAYGPLVLVVAALVVALLLAAAPASAQEAEAPGPEETREATGMEAGAGPPKVDDGSAEMSDGNRSVRVGDGCVLIEEGGGEDLAVGSCDEDDNAGGSSGGGDTADEPRPDEEISAPQDTTERTVAEGTIPEGTAPGTTDLGESTTPGSTAPEQTETADDSGADAECPTVPEGETFEATVERAVDGDTLELAEPVDGLSRVRLIGVDAPETQGEGGVPEPYAEEAAGFTASELEGERVLLELDEETTDPDGRLLAYVWRAQAPSRPERSVSGADASELFNLALVEGGYATSMPVEPNTRYAGCFDDAEHAAREEGNGLWGVGGGPDDDQYEGATGPEGTEPEPAPPKADEPEQTSPETTEPTGRTTPYPPEDDGEEPVEAPHDRYGEPEERAVLKSAPAQVPTSEDSVPPADEDGFGPDAEAEPSRGVTVPEERTVSEPSGETSEETTGTRYDQYEEPEEQAVLEVAPDEPPAYESSVPAASEGQAGYEPDAGPLQEPATAPTVAPLPALPTRQTPEGPAPVLPETGGAALLPLVLGAAVLTAGSFSLGLLRPGTHRCRGVRSDER